MDNNTIETVEVCRVIKKRKEYRCMHGTVKYDCIQCRGTNVCIHDKLKKQCRQCNGVVFCTHDKRKSYCKYCGGSMLCKSEFCHTRGNKHYNMYCLTCTINLFPDMITKRNYKTKEKHVVDHIKSHFPNLTLIADRPVENSCSKKRPDLLVDMGSHIIIIEIDEFQHKNYLCESKRTLELLQDLHFRNTVFIRFNPDEYVDESGKKIKSCWYNNKLGINTVVKTRENEWKSRLDILVNTIQYHIDNESTKNLEIIKLFF